MNLVFCLVIILLCVPVNPSQAVELNGHLKSLNLYQQAATDSDSDVWLSADSLRFDLDGQEPYMGAVWQVSLDQLFLYQDPKQSLALPDRSENRVADLAWDGNSDHSLSWQLQVDRLSLQWGQDDTVLTLGRQGVGFGRISLFSPLDIIAPFSPTALDSEVRPGVDALRFQQYFDIVGEVGATLVAGDGKKQSSLLGNLTLNAMSVDLLLIGGQLRDRPMVGIGLAGQVGGIGLKGEWAGYKGKDTGRPGGDLRDEFSIAGVELEYMFPSEFLVQLQYLYNGPGSNDPLDYLLVAQSAPVQEGLTYLYGKHYLLSGLSRNLTPLVRLSGLIIVNLKDDSWLIRPMMDLSLADNLSLELFWNLYRGDDPLLFAGQVVPRSEFGSLGDGGGLFFKYYF